MLGLFRSARATAIDERAHHAATSPRNDRPEPTRAQMDAGNYKHGHVQVQGLRIAIENPAGSVRSGVTAEGRIWRTVLKHHYGRLKGTEGADDDQVDVFIGPYPESELVFVIDQVIGGRFDEHKVILGATSEADARAIYLANYQPGWHQPGQRGVGAVTALPIAEFREWLANHDTRVPMATNRLPSALQFMKANPAADVERPGSRGGRYYYDDHGRIRYGDRPAAHVPVAPHAPVAAARPAQVPARAAVIAPSSSRGRRPAAAQPLSDDRPEAAKSYDDEGGAKDWEVTEADYLSRAFETAQKRADRNAVGWAQEAEKLPVSSRPSRNPFNVSKRDQALANAKHWREQAERLRTEGPTPATMQGWRDQYIETVKKALSKGERVPWAVIRQRPEFEKARDSRERYDKGRHTSFANESAAVNREHQRERGYKVKRQDGKAISAEQVEEIHQGVAEVEEALGPLTELLRRSDLTIAHTNGKFPFLMTAGGVYHGSDRTVTIGISDVLGRPIPALAHEMAHWLDNEAGAALGRQTRLNNGLFARGTNKAVNTPSLAAADDGEHAELISRARRAMNRTREVRDLLRQKQNAQETEDGKAAVQRVRVQLGPYWNAPSEIFARLTEQYVTTVRGKGGIASEADYTNHPGWWTAEEFAPLMPMISREIGRRIQILGGDPSHVTGAKVDLAAPATAAGFTGIAAAQEAVRADLTGGFVRAARRAAGLQRRIELNPSHSHRDQWQGELTELTATLARRDPRVSGFSDEVRAALLNHDAEHFTSLADHESETVAKARHGWLGRLLGRLIAPRRRLVKADVMHPGTRGGHYYIDHAGRVRYGVPPDGVKPFAGASSARQVARITAKKSGLFAGRAVRSTADTAEIFRAIVDDDRERFWMLHLAENNRPLAVECISQGSISQSIVHPRETFKNAVGLGTKRVAFVHNHPSEDPRPSREDVEITARLRTVASHLGINVTHHVVVGGDGYCDVENPVPVRWSDPSLTKRRQLRQVEGQISRDPGDVPWPDLFGSPVAGSYDVARVGRVLFDPGDRLAAVLLVDTKMKAVGVYPLAHDEIDKGFGARLATAIAGSNAHGFVLIASADGPQWRQDLDTAHQAAETIGNQAGVRLLDTVAVGSGRGFHSVTDDGPVSGARL